MSLFSQEFKITLKSLTYWVVVFFIGLSLFGEIGTEMDAIKKPLPNQQSYGVTATQDKKEIQKQTVTRLFFDYAGNGFYTYPLDYSKKVQPSDQEMKKINVILKTATGLSVKNLKASLNKHQRKAEAYYKRNENNPNISQYKDFTVPIAEGYSYSRFEKDMQVVTGILGYGSIYEKNYYTTVTDTPMTYRQAKKEYQDTIKKDHVVGAYARIVCDYLGIGLALIPAFVGATVMLRDKRSKSENVIYTKAISPGKMIGARYFSTVLLMLIPVLLFSMNSALQASVLANKLHAGGSILLFFEYIIGWTLPTILAVVGISFLLTEIFGGIIAIIAQFVIYFWQYLGGSQSLIGKVGWSLIPRFNSVGFRSIFENIFQQLVINRIFWSLLGVICLMLAIAIYDYKRKGVKGNELIWSGIQNYFKKFNLLGGGTFHRYFSLHPDWNRYGNNQRAQT